MIIVYGTRCYGRADVVEGLGHVTCRFVHIMFVPLIPVETIFLMDGDRGLKLPFSFKAAMSGWFRGGALFTGIASLIGAIANFADGEPLVGIVCAVFGALALGSFPLWGLIFGGCSQERKAELMGMLGIQVPGPQQMVFNQQPQQQQPMPMPQPGMMQQPAMQPAGGFGQPPALGGYGGHPQSYVGPTAANANAYGAPPQQQAVGQSYGGPVPPGYDPNRRY